MRIDILGLSLHCICRVKWKRKFFEFKKVVLIYGPKYHMKYFYPNFEFLHPLMAMQFDQTSLK